MIKTKSLLILIFSLLFSNYYLSFSQELTITTYYPSPVGIYKELRAKRMAIGDSFYDPSHYCWEGSCTVSVDSDADLIVEGKVGIKTENPQEELHVAGDTEIEGGVVIGNPTGGNKGAGTINAEKIYVDGSEIGGKIKVWSASKSDSDSAGLGETLSVNCDISVPEGYTVIYAHGGLGESYLNEYCKYPSFIKAQPHGSDQSASCKELNCLGQTGGVCENNYNKICHSSTCVRRCGSYVIAIKIE